MKSLLLTFSGVILLTSFSNKTHTSQNLQQNPKDEVIAVLDKFHLSFGKRDTASLRPLITKTGLFCGTYPDEYSDDRDEVLDYCMTDYFADTATVYSVGQREILMSKDNNSAIAMELFIYPPRSNRFQTRCNTHLIKIDSKWLIDSFSYSLVISNWDMEKIKELFN